MLRRLFVGNLCDNSIRRWCDWDRPIRTSVSFCLASHPHRSAKMSTITRKIITTQSAALPVAPYSQALVADRTVYLSGCLGLDKETKKMVEGGAGAEMRKALENMQAILKAAGSGVDKVLKVTIYLADMADYTAVNDEYKVVFSKDFPARTCIQVAKLPVNGLVEVEAIALVGDVVTQHVAVE